MCCTEWIPNLLENDKVQKYKACVLEHIEFFLDKVTKRKGADKCFGAYDILFKGIFRKKVADNF